MVDTVKTLQSLLEKRGYKKVIEKGDTVYRKEVGKIVLQISFPKNDQEIWMRVLTEDDLFGNRKRTKVCYIEDFDVEDWKLVIVYDSNLNKLYKDLCLELQQLYIKEFEALV
jgi:hypothetical protein